MPPQRQRSAIISYLVSLCLAWRCSLHLAGEESFQSTSKIITLSSRPTPCWLPRTFRIKSNIPTERCLFFGLVSACSLAPHPSTLCTWPHCGAYKHRDALGFLNLLVPLSKTSSQPPQNCYSYFLQDSERASMTHFLLNKNKNKNQNKANNNPNPHFLNSM